MRMLLLHQRCSMILLPTFATSSTAPLIPLNESSSSSCTSLRGAHCHHSLLSRNSITPGRLIREQRPWRNSAIRSRAMESTGSGFDLAANGGAESESRIVQRHWLSRVPRHLTLELNTSELGSFYGSYTAIRCRTMEFTGSGFDVAANGGGPRSCKVAVIGAGAAGIVAARELMLEHHDVTVFEQTESVGGVWVYDPEIENEDLLGTRNVRKRVHSSMYASLRTNLPREIMGYTDFPFLPRPGGDSRRFPGHAEVASYLQAFAEYHGLLNLVKFSTVVEYVGRNESRNSWKVRTRRRDEINEELFDAVVVCNGHYSEPKLADIPGISKWPGVQMHSHNYREPSSFADKIVVVIGNAASGEDISRDIAEVAKEVHISGRTWGSSINFGEPSGEHNNIFLHSTVECACEDGTVKFKSGGSVSADIILFCTGYFYYFPFLDTQGEVGVEDNCVGPLYEHVFPPSLAPSLAFVGLPWKLVPFQLFELQSRWIAMALSRKVTLPSSQEMLKSVHDFYSQLEASGKPKRLAHNMATTQYEYDNWLAEQTGSAYVEAWRMKIYEATWRNKRQNPETYRDEWPDEEWHQKAYAVLKEQDQLINSGRTPLKSSI